MVLGTEIAHNFHLHSYAIPSKVEGMEVIHGNSMTQTISALASDTFNIIYISNGNRLTLPEMKTAINRYNGHPFTVWVNEQEMIKKVRAILKACGLNEVHEQSGLLMELETFNAPQLNGEVRKAKTGEDLEYVGKNLSKASSPADKEVPKYFKKTTEAILNGFETEFYIYQDGDTPMGVVEVFPSSSETVGIYNLSVDKKFRNKGIGTSLMQHVLNTLKKEDYKYAVLQADGQALSLYERIGFRPLTRFHEFQ